jgi:hypothetical protein
MADISHRLRLYAAGACHAAAVLWIGGWALSQVYTRLLPVFGPTGWLPVPLALLPLFVGFRLLLRSGLGQDRPAVKAQTPQS